jgi:hypothetical protein
MPLTTLHCESGYCSTVIHYSAWVHAGIIYSKEKLFFMKTNFPLNFEILEMLLRNDKFKLPTSQ